MNMEALRATWLMFQRVHRVSVDRMLCRPALWNAFLDAARLVVRAQDEETLLWGLVQLRSGGVS